MPWLVRQAICSIGIYCFGKYKARSEVDCVKKLVTDPDHVSLSVLCHGLLWGCEKLQADAP